MTDLGLEDPSFLMRLAYGAGYLRCLQDYAAGMPDEAMSGTGQKFEDWFYSQGYS